jgi:Tfp pilus assembly protein PilN
MKQINLLPKIRLQGVRYRNVLSGLYLAWWITLASFALVFLAQFTAKVYLNSQSQAVSNNIGQLRGQVNKEENTQIKAQIKDINNRILDYKRLAENSPKWSRVLKAFAVLPPAGVKINSLNVNFDQKSVGITGFAPTRELVIVLYNSIRQDDQHFYNIDYPLENVAKPANVNFHFTFYVKDSLLQ